MCGGVETDIAPEFLSNTLYARKSLEKLLNMCGGVEMAIAPEFLSNTLYARKS